MTNLRQKWLSVLLDAVGLRELDESRKRAYIKVISGAGAKESIKDDRDRKSHGEMVRSKQEEVASAPQKRPPAYTT